MLAAIGSEVPPNRPTVLIVDERAGPQTATSAWLLAAYETLAEWQEVAGKATPNTRGVYTFVGRKRDGTADRPTGWIRKAELVNAQIVVHIREAPDTVVPAQPDPKLHIYVSESSTSTPPVPADRLVWSCQLNLRSLDDPAQFAVEVKKRVAQLGLNYVHTQGLRRTVQQLKDQLGSTSIWDALWGKNYGLSMVPTPKDNDAFYATTDERDYLTERLAALPQQVLPWDVVKKLLETQRQS